MQDDEKSCDVVESSVGFPPVARPDARVLILGSLPGQRSLQATEYYAHPQNVFWRIMRELTGAAGSYEQRCQTIVEYGISLWDVLAESVRPGRMDADIRLQTAAANDFAAFFAAHQRIERVCFNGQKAAQLYHRLVSSDYEGESRQLVILPSTSPAYASMAYDKKLRSWRKGVMGTGTLTR